MPPYHSDFGDRRVCIHQDCIPHPWIKQSRESKCIEEKAATSLAKNKQPFLLLEERRRVRFSIVETVLLEGVPLASQMTEAEKYDLWFCEDDSDMAKQCIATICSTTQRRPRNCSDSSSSYTSVLGRIYDQCHDPKRTNSSPVDENDQKLLAEWARNSHVRRGLEPHILESIREQSKKATRSETLVYAVRLLHSNKMIDVETKAEVIRKCSERMSRGARLFAQALAQADVESIKPRPKVSRVRKAATSRMLTSR